MTKLGFEGAVERGKEARLQWIRDRIVLGSEEFAAVRGLSPDNLGELQTQGGLFSVEIDGKAWWPAKLLELAPIDASAVCRALGALDEATKLIFLMRPHGALGGKTVLEAVAGGQLEQVVRLAAAWAKEG